MQNMRLRSRLLAGLLLGSVLTGCGGAEVEDEISSEALAGTTEPAADQILACVEAGFGGYCELQGVGFLPYSSVVPNDSMSSIKVGSRVRVTLCRDSIYGGTCETFPPGARISYLGSEPVGNDSISSLRVVDVSVPDCRFGAAPPRGWVFLFRDGGFNGDCVAHQPGFYAAPENFGLANDSISSLRVGATPTAGKDFRVNFWKDVNFQGTASFGGLHGDVDYVGDSWNDSVSSLSVTTFP